jgi:hypothetical protein
MPIVEVPRVGTGRAFDRGAWKPVFTATGPSASFTCPVCDVSTLLTHLVIALDGTVAPAFVCPTPGCPIRGDLILHGWPP